MTRRFFKEVTVSSDNGIMLDARVLKTPLKAVLKLPMPALAEAIATEWREQGEHIKPLSMPITRLANTAIDRAGAERDKIKAEIIAFAGSDMVCYRAGSPPALISRQAEMWDPVVDWAQRVLDAPFVVTTGVMHVEQPEAAIKAFAVHLHAMDDFTIAVLHNLTTLTGSALMAAMLKRGQSRARLSGLPLMRMKTGRSNNGEKTRKPHCFGPAGSRNSRPVAASSQPCANPE